MSMFTQLDDLHKTKDTKKTEANSVLVVNKISEATERIFLENEILKKKIHNLEAKLRSTKEQLNHANKLAILGNIGAGIAHELNNPLTVISGESEEILDNLGESTIDKDLLRASVKNIKKCTSRMRVIIDHIRDYSRKEQNKNYKSLNVNEPIKDSLLLLKNQVENCGISVDIDLDENLPNILGNYTKLESVFQNLISNSKDAFETLQDDRNKYLFVSTSVEDSKNVIIRVKDNAGGIRENMQKDIFNAFFTTKKRGKGTGLGLSIVASTIKDHKGTIQVNSHFGDGTEFIITLPIATTKSSKKHKDVYRGTSENLDHR